MYFFFFPFRIRFLLFFFGVKMGKLIPRTFHIHLHFIRKRHFSNDTKRIRGDEGERDLVQGVCCVWRNGGSCVRNGKKEHEFILLRKFLFFCC